MSYDTGKLRYSEDIRKEVDDEQLDSSMNPS